ncbi:MAG: cytochrome c [Flavobacteriales bacterium]|nr:cytochrome c [Flavobacteriales bacterium]
MRKAISTISSLLIVILVLSSCMKREQSPGYEYMPDMYRSPAIEAYVDYGEIRDTIREELNLSLSARKPAEGTVPRSENILNDLPYTIPNTQEGYALAGEVVKSPFPQNEEYIEMGKGIYTNFCVQCHGAEGQGNGPVVEKGGHPAPNAYNSPNLKELPEGKMFHTLTYGKGAMGSHASQLTKVERWKVIAYVKHLQKLGEEGEEESDGAEKIKG